MKATLYQKCIDEKRLSLLTEWAGEKNAPLTPWTVTPGSRKRVWWRCEKGHEWQATVKSRVKDGSGCPICAGKKVQPGVNDLETVAPEIAAQWHPTKNGALTPRDLVAGSHMRAWWRCEKGHEWRASINSRVSQGNGCPYCGSRMLMAG